MARKNSVQYVNFYTAGTAACKYEPAPVKKQAQLPKMRRKKRIVIHVDPVAIVGMCLAVVLLVMMITNLVRLNAVQEQNRQMAAYVSALQQENAQLQQQYHAGYDPNEILQIAEGMGMIPGERAQHIQIQVEPSVILEEPTAWENFFMFLTGLFA